VLKGWNVSGETDTIFRNDIVSALNKLDPGVAVGSWGQIKGTDAKGYGLTISR